MLPRYDYSSTGLKRIRREIYNEGPRTDLYQEFNIFNLQKNLSKLKGKMSSFLDRFVGRTQTVSKLGPEQLFKGREESLIYTNTHKSLTRFSTHQLKTHPEPRKEEQRSPVEQEQPFHLPHIQQRYVNSEFRRHYEDPLHTNSRMRLDKETNWLVEQPQPIIEPPQETRLVASVDPQKQNHGRTIREKQERRLKSYHLHKSVNRLGGLGPNIGGQQWMAKKQKQQKVKKYAGELKKIHRQRLTRENGDTLSTFTGNRLFFNY